MLHFIFNAVNLVILLSVILTDTFFVHVHAFSLYHSALLISNDFFQLLHP